MALADAPLHLLETPKNKHDTKQFSRHPLPNIAGTCHKGFAFVLIPAGATVGCSLLTNGKENI
ncbi:MAG: hypothetical protein ACR2OL_12730 [Anderseniella sp.]